jgi:hypothetical protein
VGQVSWSFLCAIHPNIHYEEQAPRVHGSTTRWPISVQLLQAFQHITQYAPKQVDTDEKKKYHFLKGLSTKMQERLALNADRTFLELVSNAIIADDAIRAHQESKKKKALAAPPGSAPSKY